MADIFISYAREDRSRAQTLANALQDAGYTVWWDRQQVPGQAFDEVIEEQLEACKAVVVCWSGAARKSSWVKAEAQFALDQQKYVPLLFEKNCRLPFLFRRYHAEDFSHWSGDQTDNGFLLLVQAIPGSELAVDKHTPPHLPTNTSPAKACRFISPQMVLIQAGSFIMGSDSKKDPFADKDEFPQHKVTVSYSFEIGVHLVSFAEYERFAGATGAEVPNDRGWGKENRPVINVSWDDANAYCKWLASESGLQYRLPTEAEWEHVCRAGTKSRYWWGDEPGSGHANFSGSESQWSGKKTSPLGSFKPNSWGLYDTSGNVWEWVEDHWVDNYDGAPVDGSARTDANGDFRVLRGGSWLNLTNRARSAARNGNPRDYRHLGWGFRLARTL